MSADLLHRVRELMEEVREQLSPDARTSVFEVRVRRDAEGLVLEGHVSEPAALEELHRRAALLDGGESVRDEVVRLPHLLEDTLPHARVRAAIAPMLAEPAIASTHLSQALFGHHLLVLRRMRRWLHCRSTDGYLGWVHEGYLHFETEIEARKSEIGAGAEVCTSLGGRLTTSDGAPLLPLPWGARIVRQRDGTVRLSDGTSGRLEGEIVPLATAHLHFRPDGEAVVETARQWIGAPYLWGGTTPGGVDCSGYVQAVLRLHGVELPRDSDQQARVGEPVEPGSDFRHLRAGDLLFFAEEPGRVTHVTLSAGGSHILHSSLGNGGVKENDLCGDLRFERELRELFVCARRVITPPRSPAGSD